MTFKDKKKAKQTLGKLWKQAKQEEDKLPPRGTGLINGNAGERRGTPRTDEERKKRHRQQLAKAWKQAKQTGIEAIPPEHKKIIDKDLKQYKTKQAKKRKLVKLWKDMKKQKTAHFGRKHKQIAKFSRFENVKEYALMNIAFLRPGVFYTEGKPYNYTWDTIKKKANTFIGKKFFAEHEESAGKAIGEVKSMFTKVIDGMNWLCAKVLMPEADFTKEYLDRWEQGLPDEFSSAHMFKYTNINGENLVTDMDGEEISATWKGEVTGTKMLGLKRHIKNINYKGDTK